MTTENAASLQNAEAAFATLSSFLAMPVVSDRDRAGVIQAFEFTFEAMWKLSKRTAEREGLPAESPRRALIAGYRLGLITDEGLWLSMLTDRDLTSHTYHHDVAERIFVAIRDQYAAAPSGALDACRASARSA